MSGQKKVVIRRFRNETRGGRSPFRGPEAPSQRLAKEYTGTLQADGTLATEPTFDAVQVARAVAHLVDLPLEVSIPSLTIMARAMPYFGRG